MDADICAQSMAPRVLEILPRNSSIDKVIETSRASDAAISKSRSHPIFVADGHPVIEPRYNHGAVIRTPQGRIKLTLWNFLAWATADDGTILRDL